MKKIQKILSGMLIIVFVVLMTVLVLNIKGLTRQQEMEIRLQEELEDLQNSVDEKEEQQQQLQGELEILKGQPGEIGENEETSGAPEEQQPPAVNGRKIAIDPGHQGYHVDMSDMEPMGPGSQEMKAKATAGTRGSFTGVPEYELNLTISKLLEQELKNRGYEVMLTRRDHDTAVSNRERALLAADFGADIYIRIHANGSDDPGVSGALAMVPSIENPYVSSLHDKSYALGESVINAYCQSCGIPNMGVQLSDNMTGINWSQVPVMILEMGFMTNQSDDTNMQNADFQTLMVQGIANGIDQYFAAGNE